MQKAQAKMVDNRGNQLAAFRRYGGNLQKEYDRPIWDMKDNSTSPKRTRI